MIQRLERTLAKGWGWLLLKWYGRKRYPAIISQAGLRAARVKFTVTQPMEMCAVKQMDGESKYLRATLGELQPEDVFYDLGANFGLFCLHAAPLCRQVYAFEPDPHFFALLQANGQLNGFANLQPLPWAIADKPGQTTLYTRGASGKSSSLVHANHAQRVQVECHSLDELVFQRHFPPPTALKIDIEGAEYRALLGMRRLLQQKPPRVLAIETHPQLLQQGHGAEGQVLGLLESHGYRAIYHGRRDLERHYVFIHH